MGENKEGKEKKRRPGWLQALDLLIRTWHIGVTGVLFGGSVCYVPFERLLAWHHMAIASGGALAFSRVVQSRHWPYQVRGLMALVHVGLLAILPFHKELMVPVLSTVLVLGVFAANMPGYIKQYSVIHRCRIE